MVAGRAAGAAAAPPRREEEEEAQEEGEGASTGRALPLVGRARDGRADAVAVGARAAWTGMRACMAAADMVVVRRGMEGWAPRGETVAGSARATAE